MEVHTIDNTTVPEDISEDVKRLEAYYFAIGEVSDVYKGIMTKSNRLVAIKVMRGITTDPDIRRRFEEQLLQLVREWQGMNHPNIMQCFGISRKFSPIPGLVLPLCTHGSITRYINSHPGTNRLFLLVQVASGINYLHSRGFVHADIRGSNILISSEGTPLVMDCGLSLIVSRGGDFTAAGISGPCRWMPPEILDPSDDISDDGYRSLYTAASDIHSLGMTILEVLTGMIPFAHRRYDTLVILDVIRGTRPPRPAIAEMTDDVWNILQRSWEPIPGNRPSASLVEAWLNTAYCMSETQNPPSELSSSA